MHASSGKIVPITDRRICNFLIKTPPRETGTLRPFAFLSLSRAAGDDARRIIPSYARLLHIIYLPHLSHLRIIIEIR